MLLLYYIIFKSSAEYCKVEGRGVYTRQFDLFVAHTSMAVSKYPLSTGAAVDPYYTHIRPYYRCVRVPINQDLF